MLWGHTDISANTWWPKHLIGRDASVMEFWGEFGMMKYGADAVCVHEGT